MTFELPKNIFLSIIFPAFNEADRLPESLLKTVEYLREQDYTWEIIVVDDGSSDGTGKAASDILLQMQTPGRIITLEQNRGKGAAVNEGLRAASGRFVFFSDADLSTPIEELARMLPLLSEGCDIVIGSRAQSDSQLEVHQPFLREFAGRIFNVFVQSIVFQGIKDTQCGFKGFRRDVIPPLTGSQKIHGFAFDVELLWLARRFGMIVKVVPVRWHHKEASKVGFFKDSLKMFLDLFRIRWMHRNTRREESS